MHTKNTKLAGERTQFESWIDDMGSLQGVAHDVDDLLWEINSARRHDGLREITMERLQDILEQPTNSARVTFKN